MSSLQWLGHITLFSLLTQNSGKNNVLLLMQSHTLLEDLTHAWSLLEKLLPTPTLVQTRSCILVSWHNQYVTNYPQPSYFQHSCHWWPKIVSTTWLFLGQGWYLVACSCCLKISRIL